MKDRRCVLFAGNASKLLAEAITKTPNMGVNLGSIYHHCFESKEWYCQLKENVRGADVFLIQATSYPANDNLMQLLIMIDATRRASASRITILIPSSVCYARQDRKDKSRTPISAKLVSNLIACAGANRILGLDFHSPQFAGFFDIPVDQLYAMPVFVDYLKQFPQDDLVVVSPDEGAAKRSSAFAKIINGEFAFHSKKRIGDKEVLSQGLVGDVKGKTVIIYDDMIESAGTLIEVSRVCKEQGAKYVMGLITHNCLTSVGQKRLTDDIYLDELVMTDSTPVLVPLPKNTKIITVAPLLAKAINCIHNDESVSDLFEVKGF